MKNYEAISALAGAGKTYQLTARFIALLSQDISPESILAITFTRKAAGEIFDRIISRLALAILDTQERKRLETDLRDLREEPSYQLRESDLQTWLQRIIRAMPRLRIGTIDSLFVSMTQAFAFELGLPAHMEILDGSLLQAAREQALDKAVSAIQTNQRPVYWLQEVFRQITREESKRVRDELLNFVNNVHELYLENPNAELWGRQERIWTCEPWWKITAPSEKEEELAATIMKLAKSISNERYEKAWQDVVEYFRAGKWEDARTSLARFLMENWDTCGANPLAFEYYKKTYEITPDTLQHLRRLTAGAFRDYVERLCETTAGVYRLLKKYEDVYAQNVRGAGRLSFRDVEYVLRNAASSGIKLDIDYRLDGRFDHWMIDEFQDTSRSQWEIIENLIDEVLQSSSGQRSFFYVGDPKQAIYGWRGGDSTLFDHVRTKYQNVFPQDTTVLKVCWRSSPTILDAINRMFDPDLLEKHLSHYALEIARWRQNWTRHEPAPPNKSLHGRVEVHEVEKSGTGSGDSEDTTAGGKIARVCELVKQLRQVGISSIAVLVRLNTFGDKIADAMRLEGIPVLREVNPKLCDNGVISALASMLFFADHPSDTFYFEHIRCSGLLPILAQIFEMEAAEWDPGLGARCMLAAHIRARAERAGVTGLLAEVIRVSFARTNGWPDDDFISIRLRQLMLAASDFDRLYQGAPSEFAKWAMELQVKDPVVTQGVVVMTVHKAKGLEFDAVILPDLDGRKRKMTHVESNRLCRFDVPETKAKEIGTTSGWILPLPKAQTALLDSVLRHFTEHVKRQRFYEELCLLYVAVTRAKQAVYFVMEKRPITKNEKARESEIVDPYPADLVRFAFGDATAIGTQDWYRQSMVKAPPSPEEPAPFKPLVTPRLEPRKRLLAGTPSEMEDFISFSAEAMFDPASRRGAERGSLMHELFERIAWYEPGLADRIVSEYRATVFAANTEVFEAALDEFKAALDSPEVQQCLKRPSPLSEVWTEQAFEMADGDRWITGRMDRVVVQRDASGRVCAATVIDFKTDRVETEQDIQQRVEHYAKQMRLYAQAVAKLTGLRDTEIRTLLLFTHARRVIPVQ